MSAQLLSKSSFKDKNSIRLEKWAQVFSLKRKSSSQWISTSTAEGLVLKELDEFTLRILPDKCEKNENDCVRNPIICHDMENVIQEAINKDFDQADKMREDFNITIYRKDLIRLRDGNWLNDKVSMKNIFSFTLEFNYTALKFIFLDNQLLFIFNYYEKKSLLKVYVFDRTTTCNTSFLHQ